METTIEATKGSKYLSEFIEELPKNCIFDKVLTGSGGTYMALTSKERYIIAVPTKALVRDKVTQEKYKEYKILGVSSDYPLTHIPYGCTKIICTYQALSKIYTEINPSQWNLLVDEMHLITRMISFSPNSLKWLLTHFKEFKTYTFMSATVPPTERLPEALKSLDRVKVEWKEILPVSFNCYHTTNIKEAILKTCLDYVSGTNKGNVYFFYNSITAICSIISTLRKHSIFKDKYAVMASKSIYTRDSLSKVGVTSTTPDNHKTINFVTSACFEGVDFYDPIGSCYIISDSRYKNSKYDILTTIPQIVGRLRDSIYNDTITIFFNDQELYDCRTKEELESYTNECIDRSLYLVERSEEERKLLPKSSEVVLGLLERARDNNYVSIITKEDTSIEEISQLDVDLDMTLELFPEAKILDFELYDLMNSNVYIRDTGYTTNHFTNRLTDIIGEAPQLTEEERKTLRGKSYGLKSLCTLYERDTEQLKQISPEWYNIIDYYGTKEIERMGYRKDIVRSAYDNLLTIRDSTSSFRVYKDYKVGDVVSKKDLKEYFRSLGATRPKATIIKDFFEVSSVATADKGNCFKLLRRLQ